MRKKRLVKSALILAASSGMLLTQGCSEDDLPSWMTPPWAPAVTTSVSVNANNNAAANTGGQMGNNMMQSQSLGGVVRSGNTANSIPGGVGGVP